MQRNLARVVGSLVLVGLAAPLLGQAVSGASSACVSCHAAAVRDSAESVHGKAGVGCERCHGQGDSHITRAQGVKVLDAETREIIDEAIVNPTKLAPLQSTAVCAQCHSLRQPIQAGFTPGANHGDYFAPVLEYSTANSENPPYWSDGRPRRAGNEAMALWQSQCFLKGGATCVTCHTQAHKIDISGDAKLREGGDALCTGCHRQIASEIPAHTHHAANSAGSRCVACHMPKISTGQNVQTRDHSMSIPSPVNTMRYGIPNACNACHTDQDAAWSERQLQSWHSRPSQQRLVVRADTFSPARQGDARSVPQLLKILADPAGGPVVRANAVGYLGSFPDEPSAYGAVLQALADSDALVRATAATVIQPRAAQREAVAPILASMLRDPAASVRLAAVEAMARMGATRVPPEDSEWFARAQQLYADRLKLHADDAQQQFAGGKFFLECGDLISAVSALRASLTLDPSIPAQYYLALALAREGDMASASRVLREIPLNNPDYKLALLLQAQVELRTSSGKPRAQQLYLQAQVQFRQDNYTGALTLLNEALQTQPQAAWAAQAKIYRAVCQAKLGQTQEAEAEMQELAATAAGRRDLDLQLAYIELLYDQGKGEAALQRAIELIAVAPKAPLAHFWQARVLLQLGRTNEAAQAAEEAVKLNSQLAAPHNLLMKVYQMQGRMKEAEEQAQWLRDYQRRND